MRTDFRWKKRVKNRSPKEPASIGPIPEAIEVVWLDEVDSTNRWLADEVRRNPAAWRYRAVSARRQTAGRGRLGRAWISPPGRNLAFSLCWPTQRPPQERASATLAVALGIWSCLNGLGLRDGSVKWPNDVRVRGRKISGILAESAGATDLVIGVGFNAGLTAEEAATIDQPATSLRMETGHPPPLERLQAELLASIRSFLVRWESKGFVALRDEYVGAIGGVGASVRLNTGKSVLEGTLVGFHDDGAVRLRLPRGDECVLYAGDLELLDSARGGRTQS